MVPAGERRTIVYVSSYIVVFLVVVGAFVRGSSGAIVTISPGDTIMCTGFPSTPLPMALPTIASFCAADPRCAELYGQSLGANITLFDHLFQTTTEFTPPITLETPLLQTICNKTVEQITEKLWQKDLRKDMLDSDITCGLDERHVYDPVKGDIVCMSFPGREIRDPNTIDAVVVTLMILLLVSVLLKVGVDGWDSTLRWYQLRNRIRSSEAPPRRGR